MDGKAALDLPREIFVDSTRPKPRCGLFNGMTTQRRFRGRNQRWAVALDLVEVQWGFRLHGAAHVRGAFKIARLERIGKPRRGFRATARH